MDGLGRLGQGNRLGVRSLDEDNWVGNNNRTYEVGRNGKWKRNGDPETIETKNSANKDGCLHYTNGWNVAYERVLIYPCPGVLGG